MSHWQKIRNLANDLRREVFAENSIDENELVEAERLVNLAAEHLGLELIPEHPDSINLASALAVLEDDCIFFNNGLTPWYKWFCVAHEIGHYRLEHRGTHCSSDEIDGFVSDSAANSAVEKIVGYGSGERREREANLFALEFLLSCDSLKRAFFRGENETRGIAERTALPSEIAAVQLARAVLVPEPEPETKESFDENRTIELDESQRRAAQEAVCPALVSAGPGTGKTRTLTARIAYLIEQGIDPKRILAMTFSNKAAEEMRERIAAIDARAAAAMQVMTFHAFGLDLLRAFWSETGLDPDSDLIETIDAFLLLENGLNDLSLDHYEVLHDPSANFSAILGAISRAKDELCTPPEYRKLGEEMLAKSKLEDDEDLKKKAEKVLETARVYEFYQAHLEQEKLLDFGDLIHRSVKLLREHEQVRSEVQARYDAILVDEFQDVNRACGILLKEIAGSGKTLWAVGDLRQSIYRWRGASPANMRLFEQDFPGAQRISLETNYRSNNEIVELFANFASTMRASGGDGFSDWNAHRGSNSDPVRPAVTLEVADTTDTEIARIAEHVQVHRNNGVKFKEMAVICRTRPQLDQAAAGLTAAGVPVFYLGELFSRSEVRDLLSLLDLRSSKDGHSLHRVARFSEYSIPEEDVHRVIEHQRQNEKTLAGAAGDETLLDNISATGRPKLEKLAKHLSRHSSDVSAWTFLADHLFFESGYLRNFFKHNDVEELSKRLAIYQFLKFAQNAEERFSEREDPTAAFLSHVRLLANFNEDKNFSQLPSEAESLDAVRLLTIHGAKGLEFPVVFLPSLSVSKMPLSRRGDTCPVPDGMIEGEEDFHFEEEECLFFVAMSRARDHLHLSRAQKYGASTRRESEFLERLTDFLPPVRELVADEMQYSDRPAAIDVPAKDLFFTHEIERYQRCPRDYYYTHVLGLKRDGERSIYQKFHTAVYQTIGEMNRSLRVEKTAMSEDAALAKLDENWEAAEIGDHPYAPVYRQKADELIRRARKLLSEDRAGNSVLNSGIDIDLENGSVRVLLDSVEFEGETGAVIRKFKTGKTPSKTDPSDSEVLASIGISAKFPGKTAKIVRNYLGDETEHEIKITDRVASNRLKKYESAIDAIKSGNFEPKPSADCPRCPHYFICSDGS
ncbi:MAG: UvrD-helicase domain-containing protein [Pyrinomonadaceae bacterium]|nr:UvrD-helicase domain-containing protein [Pyrinomonadaceae bacterium]